MPTSRHFFRRHAEHTLRLPGSIAQSPLPPTHLYSNLLRRLRRKNACTVTNTISRQLMCAFAIYKTLGQLTHISIASTSISLQQGLAYMFINLYLFGRLWKQPTEMHHDGRLQSLCNAQDDSQQQTINLESRLQSLRNAQDDSQQQTMNLKNTLQSFGNAQDDSQQQTTNHDCNHSTMCKMTQPIGWKSQRLEHSLNEKSCIIIIIVLCLLPTFVRMHTWN